MVCLGSFSKEKIAFHEFIQKFFYIEIEDDFPFGITDNGLKIKKNIGNVVGKITSELFTAICFFAGEKNLYTYEIRSDSKACKIFLRKEYDFSKEDILWRELLLFLLSLDKKNDRLDLLRTLKPLQFDEALIIDYFDSLRSDLEKLKVINEMEFLHESIEQLNSRIEILGMIDNPNICFENEDE